MLYLTNVIEENQLFPSALDRMVSLPIRSCIKHHKYRLHGFERVSGWMKCSLTCSPNTAHYVNSTVFDAVIRPDAENNFMRSS